MIVLLWRLLPGEYVITTAHHHHTVMKSAQLALVYDWLNPPFAPNALRDMLLEMCVAQIKAGQ